MMISLTDEEWSPGNFETGALLRAIDAVDGLRGEIDSPFPEVFEAAGFENILGASYNLRFRDNAK